MASGSARALYRFYLSFCKSVGFRVKLSGFCEGSLDIYVGGCQWEFPKIGGTLFWGPYNKNPTI